MNIDTKRLIADLAALAAEARALKTMLRTRWTRPMADEQQSLVRVQRQTTELCVLRARARGRWHVLTAPRPYVQAGWSWDREAWHTAIATRVAKDYAVPSEPARTEDGATAPNEETSL